MEYENFNFRLKFLCKKLESEHKNSMIFSAFGAWQNLKAQGIIKTDWVKYTQDLGLVEIKKYTKKDIKEQVKKAMENVERIKEKVSKK